MWLGPYSGTIWGGKYSKERRRGTWYTSCTGGVYLLRSFAWRCENILLLEFVGLANLRMHRFIADTWEYFFHRFIHMNGFLYRNIHSVHHRISVPYAFGALYSHPIETFVVDTLSDFAAMSCARLTTRQTIFFFTFAALKAVDA